MITILKTLAIGASLIMAFTMIGFTIGQYVYVLRYWP